MSKMAELDWEIEYRACEEGMSAAAIAKDLEIPIEMVNAWFKEAGIWDKEPEVVFPDAYPFADEYSPFSTSNS